MKHFLKLFLVLPAFLILTSCTPEGSSRERPFLGNADANVLIEEFSDYQCPACAVVSPQVEKLIKDNPSLARFEYYHFPLPQHENAFRAAEAAECAADQGKFWEYASKLFENQTQLNESNLKTFASNLGLNETAFNDCLNSSQHKGRVKSDLYEGRRRRVNSTPSLFVNGQLVKFGGIEQFELYLRSLQ